MASPALVASNYPALLDAFFDFHSEVVRLKQLVTGRGAMAPPSPDVIRQALLDAYEAQGARVGRKLSGHDGRVFEEARYLMIAMADEVFLHVDWPGRMPWADKPLEAHVFRTHESGERVFYRIDELLAGHASAPSELCAIYLAVLTLGFRGKYAVSGGTEPEVYRSRLAEYLARVDPELVYTGGDLCPDATAHTLANTPRKALPALVRGLIPLIIVLFAWVIFAQIIWVYWTSTIDDTLNKIETVR